MIAIPWDRSEWRCDWCGASENIQVDHCHSRGRIRGLLCGPCNRAEPTIVKLGLDPLPGYFDRDLGSWDEWRSEYDARYYQENIDRIKARSKAWYDANREGILARRDRVQKSTYNRAYHQRRKAAGEADG